MPSTVEPRPSAREHARRWHAMGVSRFSEGQFLGLLLLLILASPFLEGGHIGTRIEMILITLVLFSALVAVGGRTRSLVAALALVVPAAISKWIHHVRPDLMPAWVFLTLAVAFGAFVVGHHLLFILTARAVDTRVLCAGVSTYLMIGLVWSFAYVLLASGAPDAFAFSAGPESEKTMRGFTAFYYSFATLTSTGYGDITPVTRVSRMLSIMEAVTGTFYMAILIARLVSLHATRPVPADGER